MLRSSYFVFAKFRCTLFVFLLNVFNFEKFFFPPQTFFCNFCRGKYFLLCQKKHNHAAHELVDLQLVDPIDVFSDPKKNELLGG